MLGIVVLALLLASAASGQAPPPANGNLPNIVILFVDDWGWGDVGANWQAFNDTPNIDAKLAAKGMRFTDFHVMPICSVSRASLLTGRLGLRNGVINNFDPFSLYGLPLNETTLAEYLQPTYATAMSGKWHLGIQHAYHPSSRGFQDFLGLPMSHDYGCTDTDFQTQPQMECPTYGADRCNWNTSHPIPGEKPDPSSCHISPNNPWGESIPLYANYSIVEQPVDLWTLTQRYVDHGINFMQRSVAANKPFFYYQAFSHMHVPITHHPNFTNTSSSTSKIEHGRVYGDAQRELDFHIGRLLDSMDALGIASNTLVWLFGDNGAPSNQCGYGGSNGPFQGMWLRTQGGGGGTGKCTTWEGGHRVVGIARWPGKIPAGVVSNALVSSLDVVPTLAAITGFQLHTDRYYDGIDVSDVLFKNSSQGHDTLFIPNVCEGKPGEISTIRAGPYKAKYYILNNAGCPNWPAGQAGSGGLRYLDKPKIFNVVTDWAEANPLDESGQEYEDAYEEIQKAWAAFNVTVAHDRISHANYSGDTTCTPQKCIKPCCNPSHPLCVCQE